MISSDGPFSSSRLSGESAGPTSSPSDPSFCAELVRGKAQGLSAETRDLLLTRLEAAGVIFAGSIVLGLLRTLLFSGISSHPSLLVALVIVVFLTAFIHWSKGLTLGSARVLELAMVGTVLFSVGLAQYSFLSQMAASGSVETLAATLGQALIPYIWLMLLYGMFIPGSWQRTAGIVILIACVPIVVRGALCREYPGLAELSSPDQISVTAFFLLVSAASSVYGTHVINSLRSRAHRARRLGQYQLLERIGQGGMGEVWRARHQMLARPAAVKLIQPALLGTKQREDAETTLRRFEREARATAALSSPHSIVLYDFGRSDGGTFYYVMELLEGMDLRSIVTTFGAFSPERVLYVLDQVCDSLEDAHQSGLIHRDVKPANIYLCRLGPVFDFAKVLDFGLVKERGKIGSQEETQLTQVGSITGTPDFMSPEQCLGQAVDDRSDLYSLGCVGYWLLTGRPVFQARTGMEVMIEHVKGNPVPPSELISWPISPGLEDSIMACLKKDVVERPPSCRTLKTMLANCEEAGKWGSEKAEQWWKDHHPLSARNASSRSKGEC